MSKNWTRKVAPCVHCGELVSAKEIAAMKCDSCGDVPTPQADKLDD